jgi:hypothetical protein
MNKKQFCILSLLNVEKEIIFSVLTEESLYITDDWYVETSIQKGGIPGFSKCIELLEHTSKLICQLIHEADVVKKEAAGCC